MHSQLNMTAIVLLFYVFPFSVGLCPFPGIPSNGFGFINLNQSNRLDTNAVRSFDVGEVVRLKCLDKWILSRSVNDSIVCWENGTWSGTVPGCDKLPSNKWNLTLFTQYKSEKVAETRESFECDEVQSSYVHLHSADNLLVKDIKEIIVELCPDDTESMGKLSVSLTDENNSTTKCRLQTDRKSEKVFSCDLRAQNLLQFIKIEIEENPIFVRNVTVTLRSDDYCGFPPVPVNGKVEKISSNEYVVNCGLGHVLSGQNVTTCDSSTGQWTSIPHCTFKCDGIIFFILEGALVILLITLITIIVQK